MGQFLFGLAAGIVVGLVMEWIIDWTGLLPSKSPDSRSGMNASKGDGASSERRASAESAAETLPLSESDTVGE